jgi:bifunctional non-homologous end joining protein LigD
LATIIQSIELHSTHAGSDKVYYIQLCEVDGGFVVNYQNGRRGGTLASGTKTKEPLTTAQAQSIYDRLVKEKINGDSHYTIVGSNSTSATTLVTDKTLSGTLPMLPSAVDESRVDALLDDDCWVMQRKYDGQRMMVIMRSDGSMLGSNKLGFVRPLPQVLVDAFRAASLPVDTIYDGEMVGNCYYVFDLVRLCGQDCKAWEFRKRQQTRERLKLVSGGASNNVLRVVDTYTGSAKRERFAQLRADGAEGVVFRDEYSPYGEGRSGNCLKYKFTESATLLVDGHEPGKRSVYLGSFDPSGKRVTMGKVTIPSNAPIPDTNAIVEVGYLYAYPGTHALAQPVYKGVRSDQTLESCVLSQLKYRAANIEDDEIDAV